MDIETTTGLLPNCKMTSTSFITVAPGQTFPVPSGWTITDKPPEGYTGDLMVGEQPLEAQNGQVAIKPFESLDPQISVTKGFATIENRQNLVEAEVVFASGDYLPGDKVYVQGQHAHSYGQRVYRVAEVAFCLVPAAQIMVARKVPRPVKWDWSSPRLLTNEQAWWGGRNGEFTCGTK